VRQQDVEGDGVSGEAPEVGGEEVEHGRHDLAQHVHIKADTRKPADDHHERVAGEKSNVVVVAAAVVVVVVIVVVAAVAVVVVVAVIVHVHVPAAVIVVLHNWSFYNLLFDIRTYIDLGSMLYFLMFSPKNSVKLYVSLNLLPFMRKKNRKALIFSAENWQKIQKIVIMTLTHVDVKSLLY
jgi:hypothetical protein